MGISNVQNDGVWQVGESYTFDVTYKSSPQDWLPQVGPPLSISCEELHPSGGFDPNGYKILTAADHVPPDPPYDAALIPQYDYSDFIAGVTIADSSECDDVNWDMGSSITLTATVGASVEPGTYKLWHLAYSRLYNLGSGLWAVSGVSYSSTTITIIAPGTPPTMQTYPPSRDGDYDADLFWIPGFWAWDDGVGDYVFTDGEWAEYGDLIAIGGGRYNEQLVAIGHNQVYFEDYV